MSAFHSLYNWASRQAKKRHATWLLFFVALIEPCVFPLPPDTLLIPMCLAHRERAFRFAAVATVGSVTGGLIGYAIGALAMATVGQWIVTTYHLENAFQHFQHGFNRFGMWIILAKGVTPIPFILVTIASGVVHLNLVVFIISATITRAGRFFLEATLIHHFGEPIRIFIERYMTLIGLAVLALLGLGFWVVLR